MKTIHGCSSSGKKLMNGYPSKVGAGNSWIFKMLKKFLMLALLYHTSRVLADIQIVQ
jgi:hypothetical protein